jgi:ABC-type Fe3+/spermidine/putrescine transport system ATPase subunit
MNVADNVAFGLRAQRARGSEVTRRAGEMLELMELQQFAARRVHELSGGQQQRVALARALAIQPRVLLLDEPLGALDKKLREQMQSVLMDLHRQLGMTMVYVTHDQEEALSMSNRVAVMRQGDLVQYDTPDALYYAPNSLYVCQFVGRTNVFEDIVASIEGERVQTRSGHVAMAYAALAAGDACAVCVRPERLLFAPDENRPNARRGVVLERIFLGQTTNYVVEFEGGGRAEASGFSDAGGAAAAPGDRVAVVIAMAPAHGYPRARGAPPPPLLDTAGAA